MDVVRITELQPKTYVEQGDYIAIDNQSDGTKKVQFTNLLDDTLSQENKIAPANVVGNEIATIRAAVGSPLKASTVAQMTDTNKIYVYVGSESGYTNGNWYYWNGSAWTSGGVYNSVAVVTDPTLTLSGVPADAKATGDEISNLKSDLSEMYYFSTSVPTTYTEGKFVNNIGTLSTDYTDCASDYTELPFIVGTPITFMVTMFSNRGFAIYDADKNPILLIHGNNCTDYGYAPHSYGQEVTLDMPIGAKYIRITRKLSEVTDNTSFAVKGLFLDGIAPIVKDIQSIDFSNMVEKDGTDEVTVQNSEYLDIVYVNLFDGNYVDGKMVSGSGTNPANYSLRVNSARYNLVIVPVKPNTKYSIGARVEGEIGIFRAITATKLLSDDEYFDGSVALSLSISASQFFYTITTGENDRYIYFYGANAQSQTRPFVQICEGEISSFTTDKYNDYYGLPNSKLKVADKKSPIIITPVSTTRFNVSVLDEASGEYYTHQFFHRVYTDTLSYGQGQSKSVVTTDIWYSDFIKNPNGDSIMQGNTNFIHYLDIEGHTGHVGAGHGCVVQDWSLFFADGKNFNPTTLSKSIECEEFAFLTKAKNYLIDSSITTESAHALPTLDNNGNPIVTSTNCLDGVWKANNEVTIRNRLNILMDGIIFEQCFAGMCCGFYPYFNNVIVKNEDYLWTEFSKSGNTWTKTDKGGSGSTIASTNYIADEVVMFGDNYKVTNRITSNKDNRQIRNNISFVLPPNDDDRIKAYLMPCTSIESSASIESGQSVETFNSGDYLDVMVYRKIDVSEG